MPQLRNYQQEFFDATMLAFKTHRRVLGRAATGLGKGPWLAAMAQHFSQFGRVMILVDVKKLVRQLADTVYWFTGERPGVEMADETAINDNHFCAPDRIVVSSVQTQYSGKEGKERYRKFNPKDFSIILLDETEAFLAPKYRSVVDWYLNGNPDLKLCGVSATPLRSDGIAMANLFDTVAFDRDIKWGINEGWLVKLRQAFVHVSADFSTLSVKPGADGEADYSSEEIASRIMNEQTQIELAKGILHVAENRKSIIACPTVEVARAVAHYIDAEKPGSARCIYGDLGDEEKDETFTAFANNDFQFLSSVMMLSKGFNQPDIRAVFNCRKTKSKRLYQQLVGRGTRPLQGLVDHLATASERKAAIAASAKTDCLIANMVGVESEVRDMTILDLLGEVEDGVILERAKQKIKDDPEKDADEAMEEATEEVELERAAERALAELEAERLEEMDEQRLLRARVQVKANVDVEFQDDFGGSDGGHSHNDAAIPPQQLSILRKAKLTEREIASLTPERAKQLSSTIVNRWRKGLCSVSQAKCLVKAGYTKDEVRVMHRNDASKAMDEIKANGWKRPVLAPV